MSTEYYIYDKKRNEILSLRDIIKPEIYQDFINQYVYPKDYGNRDELQIIMDDMVDTYSPFPETITIVKEEDA